MQPLPCDRLPLATAGNLQQTFSNHLWNIHFFLPSGLVLPAGYSQLSGLCVGQQSIFYYHAQTSELVTANFLGVTRRPFILKCSSYQQYRNQNNGNGNKGIMFIWGKKIKVTKEGRHSGEAQFHA